MDSKDLQGPVEIVVSQDSKDHQEKEETQVSASSIAMHQENLKIGLCCVALLFIKQMLHAKKCIKNYEVCGKKIKRKSSSTCLTSLFNLSRITRTTRTTRSGWILRFTWTERT